VLPGESLVCLPPGHPPAAPPGAPAPGPSPRRRRAAQRPYPARNIPAGRSRAMAWPGRPVVGQRRQPDRGRRPTAVQFAGTREDMAARASGPLFRHHAEWCGGQEERVQSRPIGLRRQRCLSAANANRTGRLVRPCATAGVVPGPWPGI